MSAEHIGIPGLEFPALFLDREGWEQGLLALQMESCKDRIHAS